MNSIINKWYFHVLLNAPLVILILSGLISKALGCHEYENHMTGICLALKESSGINLERYLFTAYIWSLVLVFITVPVSLFTYSYLAFKRFAR